MIIAVNMLSSSLYIHVHLCLLWWRKLYSKLGWHGGSPPVGLHPSPLSFFFLFIYMPLHHKPVQRASGSSWACGHNTERVPHQKLPPSSPQRREESKEGGRRREKIWDKFCFTHTPQICLCSWKNCSAHLWCCVENPSISVP